MPMSRYRHFTMEERENPLERTWKIRIVGLLLAYMNRAIMETTKVLVCIRLEYVTVVNPPFYKVGDKKRPCLYREN